ncbi:uncharacterized protein LOC115187393 isoform X2 [Salmo trutta]|uniref:uncharacterized protein LOC115187393 isoform X2 n=1 Tax=Salmo trutta TaxID=8032 RepID=UPI0011321A4C|nr:uncharacterized protein LOC115187393 isoform X2 [Salmo trutta]
MGNSQTKPGSYDLSGECKAMMLSVKENNESAEPDIKMMKSILNHYGRSDHGVWSGSSANCNQSEVDKDTTEYKANRVPACINDMLIAYPAMSDFVALMDNCGTDMIVYICEVLEKTDTEKEHLYDLFVKANAKMVEGTYTDDEDNKYIKEVMVIESTLKKLLYLGKKNNT